MISAASAALEIGRTRFYQIYADYLRACAARTQHRWLPRASGGDHARLWPAAVEPLLRKLLGAAPPASYRFAASEVARRLGFVMDPATVRRFARHHRLAPARPAAKPRAPVRRWQCAKIGALWQLDATPHRFFPHHPDLFPLLNMLDDCSRPRTGARLYESENLRAHRNAHERHRKLRMTPLAAWQLAHQEKRSVLRPAPRCPWWPYVRSVRSFILVGPDGRVPVGTQRLRVQVPPRTRLVHCQHPNGDISILRHHPDHAAKPSLLLHLPA